MGAPARQAAYAGGAAACDPGRVGTAGIRIHTRIAYTRVYTRYMAFWAMAYAYSVYASIVYFGRTGDSTSERNARPGTVSTLRVQVAMCDGIIGEPGKQKYLTGSYLVDELYQILSRLQKEGRSEWWKTADVVKAANLGLEELRS